MPSDTVQNAFTSPDWLKFLENSGARFGELNQVLHFGNPEAERRGAVRADVLADLSHLAVLRVDGAEAQTFLQGQLSNDIRLVSRSRAQLSAYCNAKGRMFALFLIYQDSEGAYYLRFPAELAEPTLKRLRMYVLRSKVKLEFVNANEFGHIGLSGPNAESILKDMTGNLPIKHYDVTWFNGVCIVRLPGPHARFELFIPTRQLESVWRALSGVAMPVGAGPWSWLDIVAGIPAILPGTVEEFVPQMVNLDLIDGVSFNKGCYPGQEIVARMHYLGRLKQRMYRAHVKSASPPRPGTPVFAPDLPGQSTGRVLTIQPAPDGGYDMLIVVHLSSMADGILHLESADGAAISIVDLPYLLKDSTVTA